MDGARARMLLNPVAPFALARQLRNTGSPLGDLFSFASGLYFRGKLTYARCFAHHDAGDLVRVITTNRGLADPATILRVAELRQFGDVDIDASDERYHGPLARDARALAALLPADGVAILLGSIATAKYRDVLLDHFGERLFFPRDFVGRGDMSRGALLLRAARDGKELDYIPVAGATFHGKRAPRLNPAKKKKRRK